MLVGPRVYLAMARDGLFFKAATRVHPRFRTPVVAIVAQGVWSGLLVLSGTFGQLVGYTGFAVVLFAGIAVLALFVLRWKHPSELRPFSAWGYPVAPLFFVVASLLIVVNALWESPGPSGAGLLIIGAGYAVVSGDEGQTFGSGCRRRTQAPSVTRGACGGVRRARKRGV